MLVMSEGLYLSLGFHWYVPVHLKIFIYFMFRTMEIFTNRPRLQKEKVLINCNSSNILVHVRHLTCTCILTLPTHIKTHRRDKTLTVQTWLKPTWGHSKNPYRFNKPCLVISMLSTLSSSHQLKAYISYLHFGYNKTKMNKSPKFG